MIDEKDKIAEELKREREEEERLGEQSMHDHNFRKDFKRLFKIPADCEK